MKWRKENDEKLIELVSNGKNYDELCIELNTSKSSIHNRCVRLKIKLIKHKEIICKECGKKIVIQLLSKKEFCSHSCSAKFNNRLRGCLSDETKNKIKNSLIGKKHTEERKNKNKGENNYRWKGGISKKNDVVDGKRKCKYCGEYNIEKKRITICDECRLNYYKAYRPSCEFTFNIKKYKDKFDFSLIEKYGWYSPTNKGNNLNGVSKDHLYSVKDGYINSIDCNIIKHPANCCLMRHNENSSKHSKSNITLEELLKRIEEWVD